jgi:hypothetical protein
VSDADNRPAGEASIGDELARVPSEPLLPVEKKLIAGSLLLGAVLLGLLAWVSNQYFTVAEKPLPAEKKEKGGESRP